ncbi:MAG: hypothetical protein COT81_05820 [Candidatus Buchananbacteria bacterium CG10_big_fil_rev_8_21_14_0_10_42_9]|uniref:Peptidase M23 domain-containing protein n=1 Tax=Candidatus Buchananbacteria bacterium CG10_big_fil_rev_8_21_14_0_10_42_9 TaxID=1974526 RepID=A0A2H0VZS8_9BACT|nr:MAG: hypothetical protein COT81_05820 [Candidatus Buchananbacteria bacterium CG10_big_fil_rev_8_21_14_0_10_42_9]
MRRKTKIKYFLVSIAALAMPFFVFAQTVREITFPVDGDYTILDNFGDPRSGGRTHQGIDILADKMTPLVSAVDGYVRYITFNEPTWGYAVYINDSDGYSYRYLHINNDTPGTDDGNGGPEYAFVPGLQRGTQVSAGQHIAWVGDSGNAESTGSHLHFEIWTPEREPIDPYASLQAALSPARSTTAYFFTRDLEFGDEHQDVLELQRYLNNTGFTVAFSGAGSPGNETTYFGRATQSALASFQQAKGISPAVGYFGPITRGVINQSAAATTSLKPETELTDTPYGIQPGWLIKNKRTVEVFYIDTDLSMRWIINEAVAEKHFGSTWNQNIYEFDDVTKLDLKFGDNLE